MRRETAPLTRNKMGGAVFCVRYLESGKKCERKLLIA